MKSLFHLSLLALSLLVASCMETIDLDPMDDMPLVVQCVLTRDVDKYLYPDAYVDPYGGTFPNLSDKYDPPKQYLDLYYCRRPSEGGYEKVSDADVRIICKGRNEDKEYVLTWNGERWECDLLPECNTYYQLEVKTARGETLSARTCVPASLYLFGLKPTVYNEYYPFSGSIGPGSVPWPATNEYCAYSVSRFTYWWEQTEPHHHYLNFGYESVPLDAVFWITGEVGGKRVARLSTDHPGADGFNITGGRWNEMEYLEGFKDRLVSSAQHKDAAQLWWKSYSAYGASMPVFKDFIRIHQTHGSETSIPETLIDTAFAGGMFCPPRNQIEASRSFLLTPDAQWNPDTPDDREVVYTVRNVSYDYDRYLRDLADRNLIHGDELVSIYNLDRTYTNVKGGMGIFGAQCVQTLACRGSAFYYY